MAPATNSDMRENAGVGGIPLRARSSDGKRFGESFDFTTEYLSPLMSSRNEINRVGFSPSSFRANLEKRREQINQGRRVVV